MENITINGLPFEYVDSTKAIPINIVNKGITTDKPLEVKVDKLKTMPGATLNLNLNKGTSRNSVTVRRSSVRGVVE